MSRSRTQYLPAPRILSSEDCKRILGSETFRDAVAAGWLRPRCEKPVPRGPKRKLFDRLDIEAVESRILAGEYPGHTDAMKNTAEDQQQAMKEWAMICGCEFITDADGDICLRPNLFEDGKQVVRCQPDPSDFLPWDQAIRKFKVLLFRHLSGCCMGCGAEGHDYSECVVPDSY